MKHANPKLAAITSFSHDFSTGLLLLRVSRQIYHETASMFYGDNTFVFTRALDRHDHDSDRLCYSGAYYQVQDAPRCKLTSTPRVKLHVTIDYSNSTSYHFYSCFGSMDRKNLPLNLFVPEGDFAQFARIILGVSKISLPPTILSTVSTQSLQVPSKEMVSA